MEYIIIVRYTMDVVAGVTSVVGVAGVVGKLAFVGHAVYNILKLKECVHGVSTASVSVKCVFEALDSLESALISTSDLLKRTPEQWLVGAEARNANRLTPQVANCRAKTGEWVKEVPIHQNNSSKSIRSFFRKLHDASDKSPYSQFHQKVGSASLGNANESWSTRTI